MSGSNPCRHFFISFFFHSVFFLFPIVFLPCFPLPTVFISFLPFPFIFPVLFFFLSSSFFFSSYLFSFIPLSFVPLHCLFLFPASLHATSLSFFCFYTFPLLLFSLSYWLTSAEGLHFSALVQSFSQQGISKSSATQALKATSNYSTSQSKSL